MTEVVCPQVLLFLSQMSCRLSFVLGVCHTTQRMVSDLLCKECVIPHSAWSVTYCAKLFLTVPGLYRIWHFSSFAFSVRFNDAVTSVVINCILLV